MSSSRQRHRRRTERRKTPERHADSGVQTLQRASLRGAISSARLGSLSQQANNQQPVGHPSCPAVPDSARRMSFADDPTSSRPVDPDPSCKTQESKTRRRKAQHEPKEQRATRVTRIPTAEPKSSQSRKTPAGGACAKPSLKPGALSNFRDASTAPLRPTRRLRLRSCAPAESTTMRPAEARDERAPSQTGTIQRRECREQ